MGSYIVAWILWLLFVILLVLCWMYLKILEYGIYSFRVLLISFSVTKRRAWDISELQPIPPEALQSTINELKSLGFRRLGETQVKLPTFPTPFQSRIFVSSDGLTHAEVIYTPVKMVTFSTLYDDNAILETIFPMGERINTINFRSHTVGTSIVEAHQHHIRQIKSFEELHHHPRIMENMEDYLEREKVYREKYARRKLLRNDIGHFIKSISLIYSIAVTFAIFLYFVQAGVSVISYLYNPLLVLFLAIMPAYVLITGTGIVMASTSRKSSKLN